MRQLLFGVSATVLVCGSAVAQTICEYQSPAALTTIHPNGIVNAASYIPPALPNSGIAQGSIFAIFGTDLAPTGCYQASAPYPRRFAYTSVHITSGGQTWDAPILFTSPRQVTAILPSDVPVGTATISIKTRIGPTPEIMSDQSSYPVQFKVVRSAVGIFTRNQGGFGAGLAQNYKAASDQPLNDLMHPAQPGQIVTRWATGLGPIRGDDSALPPVGNVGDGVEVLVGGRTAQVLYAGRSPEFPAIDQINFIVPPGVEGCHVPITVTAGGIAGNFATMAITATGKTCSDHTAVPADLDTLGAAGSARTADVRLGLARASAGDLQVSIDDALANFSRRNLNDFLAGAPIVDMNSALGTCQVYTRGSESQAQAIYDLPRDFINRESLDAGPALNLTGPLGANTIARQSSSESDYEAHLGGGTPWITDRILPDFLVPGDYTLDNGMGGADVPPFTTRLTIPPLINWTNQGSLSGVKRAEDLTVTWSGGDPSREFVFISGLARDPFANNNVSFVCAESVTKGRFTVPSAILSRLPATLAWTGWGIPDGSLSIGTMSTAEASRFTAPGLDFGYFGYMVRLYRPVTYQ